MQTGCIAVSAEMQLIIDPCAKWALISQYRADGPDKECISSGGTACVNDSIQIVIKGNSVSIWPKKPTLLGYVAVPFALMYCCFLIQSASIDGSFFLKSLAVHWVWRTQHRLSPLSCQPPGAQDPKQSSWNILPCPLGDRRPQPGQASSELVPVGQALGWAHSIHSSQLPHSH